MGQCQILLRKGTFYKKRALKISPPPVQTFFERFYKKIFLDVSWKGALSENQMRFLSRLAPYICICIYIYILSYQVKLHSSPWFSAACTAAIDHGNHFCLYLKNKSAEFQVRFRQVSNHYKRVFEAAKLAYKLIKQESIPSLKLVLQLFAGLLIGFHGR